MPSFFQPMILPELLNIIGNSHALSRLGYEWGRCLPGMEKRLADNEFAGLSSGPDA